jgi:hypothetical protein
LNCIGVLLGLDADLLERPLSKSRKHASRQLAARLDAEASPPSDLLDLVPVVRKCPVAILLARLEAARN